MLLLNSCGSSEHSDTCPFLRTWRDFSKRLQVGAQRSFRASLSRALTSVCSVPKPTSELRASASAPGLPQLSSLGGSAWGVETPPPSRDKVNVAVSGYPFTRPTRPGGSIAFLPVPHSPVEGEVRRWDGLNSDTLQTEHCKF